MEHQSENILNTAAAMITAVENGAVLDDELDLVDAGIRRTIAHLLLTFFRRKKAIDAQLAGLIQRPPVPAVSAILKAAATQIGFQSALAAQSAVNIAVEAAKAYRADKFVNAVLRKVVQQKMIYPESPEQVLPDSILRRWLRFSAEERQLLTDCFLRGADFTFRLERDWQLDDVEAEPVESPAFRFYSGSGAAVLKSKAFAQHYIYIQDPAASLALSLVKGKTFRRVLDACGAPGGKALMLAELIGPGAVLTVSDRSANRQERTKENFAARNITARIITAELPEITGRFDLVLLDVPCSNTGVFRRRPDALWHFSGHKMAELIKIQNQLLDQAVERVAPRGMLLYSTCSIEPEENEKRIHLFLDRHPEFTQSASRQLLPGLNCDGAFAALLEKKK